MWWCQYRPAYGEQGFRDAQDLNHMASAIHEHNDPIDPDKYAREVLPMQPRLEAFYRHSLRDLQHILGGFAMQQAENALKRQQAKYTKPSPAASDIDTHFAKLSSLAKSKSGNWSDVVELLSVFHSTDFGMK